MEATSTPLPPGHVRKKATGEISKVQAVGSQAGTATGEIAEAGRHLDRAAVGDRAPLIAQDEVLAGVGVLLS